MRAHIGLLAVTAVLLAGCNLHDDSAGPVPPANIATKLPEGANQAKSSKQAREFRSRVNKNGTESQQKAAARIQKITGDWDIASGNSSISTDMNGGPTPVEDPMSTAETIVETFSAVYSQQIRVVVYDVFDEELIGHALA
ncbi:hypothetical protein ACFWOJ_12100 [Streptomyces sp. NPDC058439]|uniref:hypothetical protein n=1 Tax=Streptomyces sp. NPDC058439 TaxID=3346500 RepID=UPI003655B65D